MTAVANSVFTAAQFNTHVRDNLNETGPAKATATGRILVTSGLNSIAERAPAENAIATSETTASTTFTDLATVGPQVSVTTGTSAIVLFAAQMSNGTDDQTCLMDYAVSGASTRSADDNSAAIHTSTVISSIGRICSADMIGGLTAGTNTFTSKYRVGAGTGTFLRRNLIVIPL